jgi:hypothetical protein
LKNIPTLPDELFDMINGPAKARPTRIPRTTTTAAAATPAPTANKTQLDDFRDLCSCFSIAQLDNRATWINMGRALKQLGAPWTLWDEVSKQSKKYKRGECEQTWAGLKSDLFTIGKLFVEAKEGNPAKLEEINPNLNMNKYVFFEDAEYPAIAIDSPFLTPLTEDTPKTPDQETFQRLTDETMDDPSKTP